MAGLLTDPVAAELRRWASEPFVWGSADCGTSLLDYAERVTGRRFEARPSYSNQFGAARVVREAGGFIPLCDEAMEQLGCSRTTAPVRGDVGLADLPGSGLTACLCLGALWAARAMFEVVIAPMAPIPAWRVQGGHECPRQ